MEHNTNDVMEKVILYPSLNTTIKTRRQIYRRLKAYLYHAISQKRYRLVTKLL